MIMRKVGYWALVGSTIFTAAGAAEAKTQKHHSRHSHSIQSANAGMASMYGTKGDGYSGGRTASDWARSRLPACVVVSTFLPS